MLDSVHTTKKITNTVHIVQTVYIETKGALHVISLIALTVGGAGRWPSTGILSLALDD